MKPLPIGFAPLYGSALEAHLTQSGEHALHQAYELGRQALAEGVGILDLTLIHHDALSRFMLDRRSEGDDEELELAAEFLAECLSPFEMTLRGFQETNLRLSAANAELTRTNAAVADAHEKLKSETDERRKAEEALTHAKRLQAVGLLAGGVAHHFNNLLTVVLGNLEMARRRIGDDPKVLRLIDSAVQGAERGAEVTRQLLSFSRQQMLQPRILDLGRWLADITPLVSGALRGDIVVETSIGPRLQRVKADPAQLELALLNLVFNARDAMPDGGTVRIAIANRKVADGRLGLAGDYVTIEVADTGTGVPEEAIAQVFEPFFSTKGAGPGAGLGLSQVHGFVHQSGGAAEIENRPQGGAAVLLYLPAASLGAEDAQGAAAAAKPAEAAEASGRVLVVEDDAEVAGMASELLSSLGYSVQLADRAQTALDMLQDGEPVDLVFTDVMMPGGMDGLQLAQEVHRRNPRVPVLLTSGYNEAMEKMNAKGLAFIAKPYRTEELRQRLGELIKRPSAAAPASTPKGPPLGSPSRT